MRETETSLQKTSFFISNEMFILFIYFYRMSIFLFFFGRAVQLAVSQFPDQGLNLGHSSESAES